MDFTQKQVVMGHGELSKTIKCFVLSRVKI